MKNNTSKIQDCFIKVGEILASLDAQTENLCPTTDELTIFQLEKEALAEIQQELNKFGAPSYFEQKE